MNMKNYGSRQPLGSDIARVDAHEIQPEEYEEIPELTEEMLAIAVINNPVRSMPPPVADRTQSKDDPNRDKPL